jgi:hypothetical protein
VLSQVLACDATLGYEEIYNTQVSGGPEKQAVLIRESCSNMVHGEFHSTQVGACINWECSICWQGHSWLLQS